MKPNTMGLVMPCMMSAKSRALMARVQNWTTLRRREKTEATAPPMRPRKSIKAVSKGSMRMAARTRGVTSLRLGSVPMARKGNRDDIPGEGGLAETSELRAGLQDHHRTDEKAGEQNDRKRADADVVHLAKEVLHIVRTGQEIGKGTARHDGVVLKAVEEFLEDADQNTDRRDRRFGGLLATRDLKRGICHDCEIRLKRARQA